VENAQQIGFGKPCQDVLVQQDEVSWVVMKCFLKSSSYVLFDAKQLLGQARFSWLKNASRPQCSAVQ
jgi:hypothetical protein